MLTVERIHLADRITRIDARFGRLVVQFVSLLPRISFGFDKMLVADWCYNLVNALFLWAKDIAGIECWVRQHRDIIGKAFTDGLPILADLQPRIADYCALLLHQANELQEP